MVFEPLTLAEAASRILSHHPDLILVGGTLSHGSNGVLGIQLVQELMNKIKESGLQDPPLLVGYTGGGPRSVADFQRIGAEAVSTGKSFNEILDHLAQIVINDRMKRSIPGNAGF